MSNGVTEDAKEKARQEIAKLVEKYQSLSQTAIKGYTEAQTRRVFIEPLFSALGWDIYGGEEVVEEVKAVAGRVDYVFKLHGVSQFYLEAKPMRAELTKPEYIKQAVTYAYNKGITWAVLTNFEGLRLYNAQTGRPFITLSCDNYLTSFDDLWLLSKESLERNALNERAERYGALPPRLGIERRLYNQLRQWREILFTQLYHYNSHLDYSQIDEVIQRLFNRLIFIRTCEDRRIEDKVLLGALHEWRSSGRKEELIETLRRIFRDFDGYYDSDLFALHMTDNVFIESTTLESIINGLYEIPGGIAKYDFSLIDADVLGAVYEQYLGHVATVVKQRVKEAQARMDLGFPSEPTFELSAKKQHRKEQGIYYTPRFVTDYIVKETVGRFLKEHSHNEILNLKILDPACGSGSFLIRAYDELLNYHADACGKPVSQFDQWERLPILTGNIFGVDLDMQAVEIARLNLLLRSLARRDTLPSLSNTIRQGNSLISGTEDNLKGYFGRNWREKNPLNWEQEFHQVFNPNREPKVPSVTIDTCVINAMRKIKELNLIEQYQRWGLVETVKTDALDTELLDDKTRSATTRRKKAATLPEDVGICVIGHSRLGHTLIAGKDDAELQDELIHVLFQKSRQQLTAQQLRDAMHLHTHLMHQRDFFVSTDKHILGRKEVLHKKFGINAGTPEECLRFVEEILPKGFDIIIGNPPYVRIQSLPRDEADYYREHYQSAFGSFDIYVLFLEQAIKLLKPGGRLGFITSGKFLKAGYGKKIQQILHEECAVENIIDLSAQQVFAEATTYPVIIVLQKGAEGRPLNYTSVPANVDLSKKAQPLDTSILTTNETNQESIVRGIWPPVTAKDTILAKLSKDTMPLAELTERIFQGLKTSADRVYSLKLLTKSDDYISAFSTSLQKRIDLEKPMARPLIKTGQMRRYYIEEPELVILFPYSNGELLSSAELEAKYPKVWRYLNDNMTALKKREGGIFRNDEQWYRYGRNQALRVINSPKIITPDFAPSARYSLDATGEYFFNGGTAGGYGIIPAKGINPLFLLGLLNSKILDWFLQKTSSNFRGGWFSYESRFISHIPIRRIDFDNPSEKKMHNDLVALVEKMLGLNKRLARIRNTPCNEHDELLRQIERTDKEIDNLVYDLYGLTEEERKIVEGNG